MLNHASASLHISQPAEPFQPYSLAPEVVHRAMSLMT